MKRIGDILLCKAAGWEGRWQVDDIDNEYLKAKDYDRTKQDKCRCGRAVYPCYHYFSQNELILQDRILKII